MHHLNQCFVQRKRNYYHVSVHVQRYAANAESKQKIRNVLFSLLYSNVRARSFESTIQRLVCGYRANSW